MTSKEIRKTFLDFFASKGHTVVPSAPVVVKGDPTLMFTNAGMNQFKDWFLGNREPKYNRVADSQKCLRVSGKHNDLEEVGHDTYHHTLFEMLGNWSFGDYFKKEAISWAWELLTDVYGLDKERLYATIFEGYEPDGQPMDTEARDIWKQFLPEDHIIPGNKHDNFWEMGDTGPCGPCSEIHIDLRSEEERKKVPGAQLVNKDNPLVIEIWNLVFMQFNRKQNGELEPLPKKHVDTGMGFERLCMALQAKKSNYDTDVFTGMINAISRLSGKPYVQESKEGIAMRVIADHIRAISFSIADGQLPSNVKAGYVIRRILRRAVRYGYTFLGFNQPFLCRLVPQLVDDMGEAFPEIKAQQGLIEKVIREEEEAFLRTLDKGIRLMDNIIATKVGADKVISGVDAFVLYDTYGFPIDLSELIARENGLTIDMKAFEAELAKQKERARNATAIEEGDWVEVRPYTRTEFIGYDKLVCHVNILKYRTVKAKGKEFVQLVFDRTPFYAESGGQVGDCGTIECQDSDEKIVITNTIKENNLPVHIADRIPGKPEAEFLARVNAPRRAAIASNHSATHLLQFALREIIGKHIEQKGSFVCPDYLRFDFSHYEKISPEVLRQVERRVNELIRADQEKDERRGVDIDEAKKLGAMSLFGEKYGKHVRVIRFGDSVEFCGGTHVNATGCIGYFRIISESAVAAGVRRIEAVTGAKACESVEAVSDELAKIRSLINNPNAVAAIQKLIEENESMKVDMAELNRKKFAELKDRLVAGAKDINGRKVIIAPRDTYSSDGVRNMAFLIHNECTNTVFIAAFTTPEGKACLTLMYTDDLVNAGADASANVREAARLIQGGGGGQKFLATAGGKNPGGLEAAEKALIELATK